MRDLFGTCCLGEVIFKVCVLVGGRISICSPVGEGVAGGGGREEISHICVS